MECKATYKGIRYGSLDEAKAQIEKDVLANLKNSNEKTNTRPKVVPETTNDKLSKIFDKNFIIKDLPLKKQEEFIDIVFADIVNRLLEGKGTTMKGSINAWRKVVSDWNDNAIASKNKVAIKEIGLLHDNFDTLMNILESRLLSTNILKLKEIEGLNAGYLSDEADTGRTNFADDWAISLTTKDTSSAHLKLFLFGIEDTVLKNKRYLPIPSFYDVYKDGKPTYTYVKYVPANEVSNVLTSVLSNNPENTWESYKATLQKAAPIYPFLTQIIERIDNAEEHVQNEFVSVYYTASVNLASTGLRSFINYKRISDTKILRRRLAQAIPLDSGISSRQKAIREYWNRRFNSSRFFKRNNKTRNTDINKKAFIAAASDIESVKNITNFDDKVNKIFRIFNKIGITTNKETIYSLFREGYTGKSGIKFNIDNVFDIKGGIFYDIVSLFNDVVNDTVNDAKNVQDTLTSLSSVVSLAKIEAVTNFDKMVSTLRRGDNKTVASATMNYYISTRVNDLKNDKTLLSNLSKTAFAGKSTWLKELKKKNSLLSSVFGFKEVDSLFKFGTNKKQHLSNMSEGEIELTTLSEFMNAGTIVNGKHVSNFAYSNVSDADRIFMISAISEDLQFTTRNGKTDLSDVTLDRLYDIFVKPELARINEFSKKRSKNASYNKGASKFLIFDKLNSLKRNSKTFKADAKEIIRREFKQELNNTIEFWKDNGIVVPAEKSRIKYASDGTMTMPYMDNRYYENRVQDSGVENPIVYTAYDYIVNNAIANMNMLQLMVGDPALYFKKDNQNTFYNISKRLQMDKGTGMYLSNLLNDEFNILVVKDVIVPTTNDYISKFKQYGEINATDGHEFITIYEHLKILFGLGRITRELYDELVTKSKNGKLDDKDISIILYPLKPQYVHNQYNPDYNIEERFAIKSFALPLIPQMTRNTQLDALRIFMEEGIDGKSIDRLVFESALKVGVPSKLYSIISKKGDIVIPKVKSSNILTLDRRGFKIQHDVKTKSSTTITDSSQKRKMFFTNMHDVKGFEFDGKENLSGKEMKDLYEKTYGGIYKIYKDMFVEQLYTNDKPDIEKLQSVILREAVKRGFNTSSIKGLIIEKVNDEYKFKIPLIYNSNGPKIESLLNSLINNRINTLKLTGTSFVSVTEVGFKSIYDTNVDETPGIVYVKNYDPKEGLHSSYVDDNNVYHKDQVLITNRFTDNNGNVIDFLEKNKNGDYIWLDENGRLDENKVPDEVLQGIGFRTPYQALNNTSNFEIVGFLPSTLGNIIVAPKELTVRMGSDFDIDKLNVRMFDATLVDGVLHKRKYVNNAEDTTKRINEIEQEFGGELTRKLKRLVFDELDNDIELASRDEYPRPLMNDNGEYEHNSDGSIKYGDNVAQDLSNYTPVASIIEQLGIKKQRLKDLALEYYIISHNPVAFYENRLLDMEIATLSNPDSRVQDQLNKPLPEKEYNKVGAISDDIRELRSKNDKSTNVGIMRSYQRKLHMDGKAGANSISVFSVANAMNSAIQGTKFKVGTTIKNLFISDEVTLAEGTSSSLTNPRTVDDKSFISDYFTYYQVLSLDNAKDPKMEPINVNQYTYNAYVYLTQLGFGDIVPYFISQDIILDYVKEKASNKGVNRFSKFKSDKTIAKELYMKYGGDEDAPSKHSTSMTDLGVDKLRDLISGNIKGEEYDDMQRAILQSFVSILRKAKKYSAFQAAVRPESPTHGIGKTFIYTIDKANSLFKLMSSNNYDGLDSVIGTVSDVESENSFEVINEYGDTIYFTPSTIIGHSLANGLLFGVSSYKDIFAEYFNPTVQSIIGTIIDSNAMEFNSSVALSNFKNSIWNSIKQYLYLTVYDKAFPGQMKSDRERLLSLRSEEHKEEELNNIFEAAQSSTYGIANPFFQSLEVVRDRGDKVTHIVFKGKSNINFDDVSIAQGAIDAYMGDNTLVDELGVKSKDLLVDIIKYSILTGNINSQTSILPLIPYEILDDLGIIDGLNKLQINDKTLTNDVSLSVYYHMPRFITQFMQHNPEQAINVNKEAIISIPGTPNFTIQNRDYLIKQTIIIKGKPVKVDTWPTFISRYDYSAVGGMRLYKLYDTNEKPIYQRIPVLSTVSTRKQYDSSKAIGTSVDEGTIGNPNVVNKESPFSFSNFFSHEASDISDIDMSKEEFYANNEEPKENRADNINEYFDETDNNTSGTQRILSKLSTILNSSSNPLHRLIASQFHSLLNVLDINIDLETNGISSITIDGKGTEIGNFVHNVLIKMNSTLNSKDNNVEHLNEVLLHELGHLIYNIASFSSDSTITKHINELRAIYNRARSLFVESLKNTSNSVLTDEEIERVKYGFSQFTEFYTMALSSKEMQKFLNSITYDRKKSYLSNVIDKFVKGLSSFIRHVLGSKGKSQSYLENILKLQYGLHIELANYFNNNSKSFNEETASNLVKAKRLLSKLQVYRVNRQNNQMDGDYIDFSDGSNLSIVKDMPWLFADLYIQSFNRMEKDADNMAKGMYAIPIKEGLENAMVGDIVTLNYTSQVIVTIVVAKDTSTNTLYTSLIDLKSLLESTKDSLHLSRETNRKILYDLAVKRNNETKTFEDKSIDFIDNPINKDELDKLANTLNSINDAIDSQVISIGDTNAAIADINEDIDESDITIKNSYDDIEYVDDEEDTYIPDEEIEFEEDNVDNGNIKNPLRRKPNRGKNLIINRRSQLNELSKQKAKIIIEKRNAISKVNFSGEPVDADKIKSLKIKEFEITQEMNRLRDEISKLTSVTTIEEVQSVLNRDVERIETLLKYKPSIDQIAIIRGLIHMLKESSSLFLTEEEADTDIFTIGNIENGGTIKGTGYYEAKAGRFDKSLELIENKLAEEMINTTFDSENDSNINLIFALSKDINYIKAHTLDISRTDNALLQAVYEQVTRSSKEGRQEIISKAKEIETKSKTVLKRVRELTGESNYNIFRQMYKTGKHRFSGNFISPFSPEYDDKIDYWLKRIKLHGLSDIPAFREWQQKNQIVFDMRLLFPDDGDRGIINDFKYSDEARDAHIAELLEVLGEREYNRLYEIVKNKHDQYIDNRNTAYEVIENTDYASQNPVVERLGIKDKEYTPDMLKNLDYMRWDANNSPYVYMNRYIDSSGDVFNSTVSSTYNGYKNTMSVPRKVVDGKKTDWYDSNFDIINNDKTLYDFYTYVLELMNELNSYLPYTSRRGVKYNSIPTLRTNILSNWGFLHKSNLKQALKDLPSALLADVDNNEYTYGIIDPRTQKVDRNLHVDFIDQNRKTIKDMIEVETAKYIADNGHAPSSEVLVDIKKEIVTNLADTKSFDIEKVLKVYSNVILTYKYKSLTEDLVRISDTIIHRAEETIANAKGKVTINKPSGNVSKHSIDESFKYLKLQWDYYVNAFYGQYHKKTGSTSKAILNSREKELKIEITNTLNELETSYKNDELLHEFYVEQKLKLQDMLDNLGNPLSYTKSMRSFLKFIQLKGMGWNLFSAFNNISFGVISNYIEAAGGKYYGVPSLTKAYSLLSTSIIKNFTFNTVEIGAAKKIRTIMDSKDILNEIQNELSLSSINKLNWGIFKFLQPYNLQNRTEYINQAAVTIAIMMDYKLDNGTSMWDMYDSNGKFKGDEVLYENSIREVVNRIEDRNKQNHGNYNSDSPIAISNTVFGQSIKQFRTWMFEGGNARYGGRFNNRLTGIEQKGRYVTVLDYLKRIISKEGDNRSDEDKDLDRENFRKIAMEASIYAIILALRLMLSGGDDKEKDKGSSRLVKNYLTNQLLRAATDIAFYFDPTAFQSLTRNALPATRVITDIYQLGDASVRAMQGDDRIKAGFYKDNSRLKREIMQFFPPLSEVYKTYSASGQVYKKRQ